MKSFFSIFLVLSCSIQTLLAQNAWSELDQSANYGGPTADGVAIDDGYLFLVDNEDDLTTLVRLSEDGKILDNNPLSTPNLGVSGSLYPYDGNAFFVGYELPTLNDFSFSNWFENRRNLHFQVGENLAPIEEFKSMFEVPNQFFYSVTTFAPLLNVQEPHVSQVSESGIVYRYATVASVLDTIDGLVGSLTRLGIWYTYDLVSGEQTQRTLSFQDSANAHIAGAGDLLQVDSIFYLPASYRTSNTSPYQNVVLTLDTSGDVLSVTPTDAISFSAMFYRLERSGDFIFTSKVAFNNEGGYDRIWEKRNLNFELIDQRKEPEAIYGFKSTCLQSDGEGGIFAVMAIDGEQSAVVVKRFSSDLTEMWSIELPDIGLESSILRANDGGVIVYNSRQNILSLVRLSKDGNVVSSSTIPTKQTAYFNGPNPTSGKILFSPDALQVSDELELVVHSTLGQQVYRSTLTSREVKLPSSLSAGMYVLTLVDGTSNSVVFQQKVMLKP